MSKGRNSIRVLFLGQCLNYGYEGVARNSTFPHLVASTLGSRYPGLNISFDFKYLYHPTGLKAILQHRLLFSRPDLAVINLPAMYAATHWRVNLIYQIAPELVDTARSFMRKIEAKARQDTRAAGPETMIDKTFARHPPLTLEEYGRLVEEAVAGCQQTSTCRVVLMGPGRFNEDTFEDYAVHTPELWRAVNEMVLSLGKRLNVPVINAQEALSDYGGEVFLPNNHRFSRYGHEVIAREVESVLVSQISAIRPASSF